MKNKTITVKNVNINSLKKQQKCLINIRNKYDSFYNASIHAHLSGLIHFLDACVDATYKEDD